MAISDIQPATPLKTGARFDGLNKIAELRSQLWGGYGDNPEVERFISDMRDTTDSHYADNKRALGAIFFLAGIPAPRHDTEFNELTTAEKKAFITAMNHFKAVVSLFPKKLYMPI